VSAARQAVEDALSDWRESREPGWYKDIGYALQSVLQSHRYTYKRKGSKPDDPGWHECSCGDWEGYWSSFEPHVADRLREVVAPVVSNLQAARSALAACREVAAKRADHNRADQ
jgi:hypothetical protein